MTGDLRVGIVGAGMIAGVHARSYAGVLGAHLVAVADPVTAKADRLAADHGAVAVDSLDAMLDLGVEIVDVCTPPQTHADLAVAALRAGRHVLCEKPLARTLEDAHRIERAAADAAGLLMVGHVSRYEADHRAAKAVVDAGDIGELRMVSHVTGSALPGWSEAGWLADPGQSGGPLLDQGVHSFDFARWLIGSPAVRVHCMAADSGAGPATYALATVRYANGAVARIETSWAHPASRGFKLGCELVGTQGRVTWSYDQMMAAVLHPTSGDVEWYPALGEEGFVAELRSFVEAIQAGAPSPVPAAEGLESLRTALAALESVRTGRTVDPRALEAEVSA
jgi:myo-inositol 2-dehydrogenase/D-chiro-inositol 1-dehydrogenase